MGQSAFGWANRRSDGRRRRLRVSQVPHALPPVAREGLVGLAHESGVERLSRVMTRQGVKTHQGVKHAEHTQRRNVHTSTRQPIGCVVVVPIGCVVVVPISDVWWWCQSAVWWWCQSRLCGGGANLG
eukprot:6370009-Prymnesium_polylepis.1